ncbi:MAG: dTDP-4-dehydrorhamnose 3,5-epimerase family protein [Patescibacteria group bacterium]
MKILSVIPLALEDVKVINFERFHDDRGYFTETLRVQDITTAPKLPELHGVNFYQLNESISKTNVLRGLHFQWEPHMGKLVRSIDGSIIDIALDIRPDSVTFGKAVLYKLSYDKTAKSQDWLWVPAGFAHGFLSLTEDARIEYACTGWWNPQCERGITVFDKEIDWSLANKDLYKTISEILPKAILNQKDKEGMTLSVWKTSDDVKKFASTLPKTK